MADDFAYRLERRLKIEKERYTAALLGGASFDISEYKYQLGLFHGIQRAMEMVEEVRASLEKEDGFE